MPSRRWVPAVFLLVLLASLGLVGCDQTPMHNTSIFPPYPATRAGDYQAQDVDLVVDAFGTGIYLLEESNAQGASRLNLIRFDVVNGIRSLVIEPAAGYSSYENPAITTAGPDGTLYLAWQAKKATDQAYINCWAAVARSSTTAPGCTPLDVRSGKSNEPPVIVAGAGSVYVIYSVQTASDHALIAAQIQPDNGESQVLLNDPGISFYYEPSAAVGKTGTLQILYGFKDRFTTARYARYSAGVGFDANVFTFNPGAGQKLQGYSLALQPVFDPQDDLIHLAIQSNPILTGDSFIQYLVYSDGSPAPTIVTTPLDPAQDWSIPGTVQILEQQGQLLGYFAGSNKTVTNQEIWSVILNNPEPAPPVQLTHTALNETQPVVTQASRFFMVYDPVTFMPMPHTSYTPVVLFRQAPQSGVYADVFVYDRAKPDGTGQVRQPYNGPDSNTNPIFTVKANGDMVYAGWIDLASTQDARKVLWISYNRDYTQTFIPAVTR